MTQVKAPPAPTSTVADDVPRREMGAIQALGVRLIEHQTAAVSIALVLLVVFFTASDAASFATRTNAINLSLDASAVMLIAAGTTFVMISGGLDLSIGSVVVFSSVVSAKAMSGHADTWMTVLQGLGVAVACGLAWGAANAFCIVRLQLPALIVTLASLSAAQGAAELIAGETDIPDVPGKLVATIGTNDLLGVPYLVWIAAAIVLVLGAILAFTRFGSRTYCIGSGQEAARRAGVPVSRHTFAIYCLSGALAGLTGFLTLAQFGTTSLDGHASDVLTAITAVVLGGVSLYGGSGVMFGTVIGVFIPVVLANGFTIVGLAATWQQIAVGAVLVMAVYLDRLRRQSRDMA